MPLCIIIALTEIQCNSMSGTNISNLRHLYTLGNKKYFSSEMVTVNKFAT